MIIKLQSTNPKESRKEEGPSVDMWIFLGKGNSIDLAGDWEQVGTGEGGISCI